jgi:ribosomal protein S1
MKKNNKALLTFADEQDLFTTFKNDKERIRYNSNNYNKMSIGKAFSIYYGLEMSNEVKSNRAINQIVTIEIGKIYLGTVKEFNERFMTFEIPGVKDEIISKEGLWTYAAGINNFLLTHDNKLLFEVREKVDGKYYVSVLNAYYTKWIEKISKAFDGDECIDVHIDELVISQVTSKGGYICHCDILPLTQLTGHSFTSSVFIPGSHIVLNIEHDFKRWIGQTVQIIPQKFVDFKVDKRNGTIEKSLVGSRKKVLQILGMHYLHDLYNQYKLGEQENVQFEKPRFSGTVTGVINADKKRGVFVELDDKYITGLLPIESYDLLNYKIGDKVDVRIAEFEVQPEREPFIIKNNKVIKCHTRPIFELA